MAKDIWKKTEKFTVSSVDSGHLYFQVNFPIHSSVNIFRFLFFTGKIILRQLHVEKLKIDHTVPVYIKKPFALYIAVCLQFTEIYSYRNLFIQKYYLSLDSHVNIVIHNICFL